MPSLYNLPVTGLRFFTVYGPWGRPDMALFLFTKNILAGKPIDVFNYGNHRRDFTYVDDIAQGVVRAADRVATANPDWNGDEPDPGTSKAPYRLYNIGNNQPVELMRYIECIERCLGRKAQKNLLPLQPGDVPDTFADIDDLVARRRLPAGDAGGGRRRALRALVCRLLQGGLSHANSRNGKRSSACGADAAAAPARSVRSRCAALREALAHRAEPAVRFFAAAARHGDAATC